MKVVAKNKKAFFDYEILKQYEAGLSLSGSEIKSIREGNVNLKGSFVTLQNGEVYWKSGFIKRWRYSTQDVLDEARNRKLLMHKREISELEKELNERGNTIIPLALKLVRGKAKLDIALARGKKKYDKRESIKKRDIDRQIARGQRF